MALGKMGKMAGIPPAGAATAGTLNASAAVDVFELKASAAPPAESPTRRTTGWETGQTPHESPADRDSRDLAATLANFTAPMRIAFHGSVAARRAAGEPVAGLEWRAVVDVRRRFDPAGWIVAARRAAVNRRNRG